MLHRSELGDIHTVTSVTVVAEVRHRLMLLEASTRFHVSSRQALSYLRRHPEQVRWLRTPVEAINSLEALRVQVLPLSMDLILASQRASEEYGLLTNDGLIIATMRAHHFTHLASNDTDFVRVPGITLWRP